MRYTPTLKLSTRLTAFVTMIVICAMFILFVGGTLSIRKLGQEYVSKHLDDVITLIDQALYEQQLSVQTQPSQAEIEKRMQQWLPKVLEVSSVVEMDISTSEGSIFYFNEHPQQLDKTRLYQKTFLLEKSAGYRVTVKVFPPYLDNSYSFTALSSTTLAVILVVFCLVQGIRWLRVQFKGSELLEERGRMILAGKVAEYAKGDEREWPYTASQALDLIVEELQDARQERSRFDTFIRTHTFLDQLTGAANRVLFDSKLESALQESGATGAVLMLRLYEWEEHQASADKQVTDDFIVEVGRTISNIVQRFPNIIFSRYYDSDFAVLIPYQNSKDISVIASQCIRQLQRIKPLPSMDTENWCHIGFTMYFEGERRCNILSEVDSALKNAQLQNSNQWSNYKKQENRELARGSVRWRTLFEKSFQSKSVLIYAQPCFVEDAEGNLTQLHSELFARINDEGRGVLKASRFISAIEQVGYEAQMDKVVLANISSFLKTTDFSVCYSINLCVLPFQHKAHQRWLRDELLQLTNEVRSRLSFEFVEGHLVRHLDFMRPVIKMLSGLGCKIVVGQAGRTIVSTHYIKDLNVDFLKLHRNLIKSIEQRQENQLFIRSLAGACEGLNAKVIAVGVETEKEWQTLLKLGIQGGQGRLFEAEKQLYPKVDRKPVQIGRRNRWRTKK